MYCHFVPQTYQKSWHSNRGSNNIIYFNKDVFSSPINDDGGNVNKNFGIENLYIFSNKDFENGVDTINVKTLENSFDKYLENSWNSVVRSLTDMTEFVKNNSIHSLSAIKKEEVPCGLTYNLLNFIILQFLRVKDNFKHIDNGKIEEILIISRKFYSNFVNAPESDIEDLTESEDFYNSIWKMILLDCFKNDNENALNLIKNQLINKVSFTVFYTDNEFDKLILSDNPVIWNVGPKKKFYTIESGVFMPINPNMLIALLNFGDKLKTRPQDFVKATSEFFKHINYLLNKNSNNYIAFNESNISQHFLEEFSIEIDWNLMFK